MTVIPILGFSLAVLLGAPPLYGGEVKPAWQVEWEKTQGAAKREGKVVVYFWQGGNLEKALQAFQRKYPDVGLSTIGGRGSDFVTRIASELRAGKYLADVCICGVTSPYKVLYKQNALEPLKAAFLLPEVADESKWWKSKHHFQDPEGRYIFVFWGRAAATRISYNSRAVAADALKSYWDLAAPKWKRKIVAIDPNESAGGWRGFYYKPGLGAEFLTRLFREAEITFSRSDRQAVDWLATEKFALGLFLAAVPEAKAQGLAVDEFNDSTFKEAPALDTGGNGTLVLLKQAPHPNAAKLFINWFLSREGQIVYQEIMNTSLEQVESMREDIPKDPVPEAYRRRKGVEYVQMFTPDRMDAEPVLRIFQDTVKQ